MIFLILLKSPPTKSLHYGIMISISFVFSVMVAMLVHVSGFPVCHRIQCVIGSIDPDPYIH
jgi:hypothetical protein